MEWIYSKRETKGNADLFRLASLLHFLRLSFVGMYGQQSCLYSLLSLHGSLCSRLPSSFLRLGFVEMNSQQSCLFPPPSLHGSLCSRLPSVLRNQSRTEELTRPVLGLGLRFLPCGRFPIPLSCGIVTPASKKTRAQGLCPRPCQTKQLSVSQMPCNQCFPSILRKPLNEFFCHITYLNYQCINCFPPLGPNFVNDKARCL